MDLGNLYGIPMLLGKHIKVRDTLERKFYLVNMHKCHVKLQDTEVHITGYKNQRMFHLDKNQCMFYQYSLQKIIEKQDIKSHKSRCYYQQRMDKGRM